MTQNTYALTQMKYLNSFCALIHHVYGAMILTKHTGMSHSGLESKEFFFISMFFMFFQREGDIFVRSLKKPNLEDTKTAIILTGN